MDLRGVRDGPFSLTVIKRRMSQPNQGLALLVWLPMRRVT